VQSAPRPDPKAAGSIFVQRLDVAVCEAARISLVENGETHAVEPDEPALGAEPDVAVAGLEDRLNRVLRKAVLGSPDLMRVLRDRLVRVERRGAARRQEEQETEGRRNPARGWPPGLHARFYQPAILES
jgi:hypothetical protein